jgi:hypothetical protein
VRIKNIYGAPILFENLGYELQPDEDLYIYELGNRDFIKQGSEELVDEYLDNKILMMYNDGTEIHDFPTILSILNGDVADVNITSISSDSEIVNVEVNSDYISDDYYYFARKVKLLPGQMFSFVFRGYIGTATVKTEEADMVAYIDNPKMSDFYFDSFSESSIDVGFRKKDMLLRMAARAPSIFTIFCDGIYRSDDGKTKEQYIKELESKNNISEYVPEELRGLIFDLDLQKDFEVGSKVIVDEALYHPIKVFGEADSFHNNRYIPKDMYFTCGNILTMQYGKEHSLTTWVKFANLDDCYIIDNYEQFYIKMYHNSIYVSVRGSITKIESSPVVGKWYNISFVADDIEVGIFLNGNFVLL